MRPCTAFNSNNHSWSTALAMTASEGVTRLTDWQAQRTAQLIYSLGGQEHWEAYRTFPTGTDQSITCTDHQKERVEDKGSSQQYILWKISYKSPKQFTAKTNKGQFWDQWFWPQSFDVSYDRQYPCMLYCLCLTSTKTECDYLNGWIENRHICKNLTPKWWIKDILLGTQKKKKKTLVSYLSEIRAQKLCGRTSDTGVSENTNTCCGVYVLPMEGKSIKTCRTSDITKLVCLGTPIHAVVCALPIWGRALRPAEPLTWASKRV